MSLEIDVSEDKFKSDKKANLTCQILKLLHSLQDQLTSNTGFFLTQFPADNLRGSRLYITSQQRKANICFIFFDKSSPLFSTE